MRNLYAAAVSIPLAFPLSARADMSDIDYCNVLAAKYRLTIGNSNQTHTGLPEAIVELCGSKPADVIPPLEQVLKDSKVALPKR
jgi:hypothetical protein